MEFNTICELVDKASATYGRKLLYKTETSSIAYKELTPMVDNYAINLNDVKGEKIGILSENRFEWEIAFFAILKSGNIVVPLDKNLTVDEIKEIVASLNIKYVFTSNLYAKKLSRIENVMVFEDLNVMDNLNKTLNPVEIKPENEAVIAFTSGTTRTAKMVVLTHKNLCSNIHSVEQVYDLGTDDVCLSAMPLSHVLEGLFNMLNCINVGATRVHINGVENIIDALDNYKITYMGAVPAVLDYLLNYEEELSHVAKRINMFMCGGAKLSPDTVNGYAKLGIKVIQGYGLTECSPVVSLETDKHHRLGSVGKPLPGVTVEIEEKDEDGIGQIVITSDSTGTYKDIVCSFPELYTGDLGYIDEDGFLFISGRKKDMIVLQNGKKVFPEEIEAMLNRIDLVKESLVYEDSGKIVALIVTDNIKNKAKIEEKVERVNKLLSVYKRVQNIKVQKEELPKTVLGKIKRNIAIPKDNKIEKGNNKEAIVISIVKEQTKKESVKLEDKLLEDLGADSLDIATIICKVQKEFNVKFSREQKANIKTVKDIIKEI